MNRSPLHLLGTGGYHPSTDRHTACLYLPDAGLVLDAGTAFFRLRDFPEAERYDILLSHAHLDHVMGLTFLIDVLFGRRTTVDVHGLPEHLAVVKNKLFGNELFPVPFKYGARELPPTGEVGEIGGWTVRWRKQVHPGGSVGYRLEKDGRSFAYITDTVADPNNAEALRFIQGVDVLIHECYFFDEMAELAVVTGHSTVGAVAATAKKAEAGELVLVHVNPIADRDACARVESEARKVVPTARLAFDGMTVEV
ncbi:MAG: MBL fold metallo-hydrolase [Planctomycetia bacterium]